jgi:hypothetical protein
LLPYVSFPRLAMNAEVDLDDGMTWTLHASGYTLDRVTDDYANDATNELSTAGGYTAGGISAGVVSRTTTAANSWAVQRAASFAYVVGDVVRPAATNGFLYRATNSGSTGAGLPTYPTVLGQTVVDGGVTWECYGIAITVFTAANAPTWTLTTAVTTIRYLVLADRTTGVASTSPLVAVTDFGTNQSGTNGTWTVTPHTSLGFFHFIHT